MYDVDPFLTRADGQWCQSFLLLHVRLVTKDGDDAGAEGHPLLPVLPETEIKQAPSTGSLRSVSVCRGWGGRQVRYPKKGKGILFVV